MESSLWFQLVAIDHIFYFQAKSYTWTDSGFRISQAGNPYGHKAQSLVYKHTKSNIEALCWCGSTCVWCTKHTSVCDPQSMVEYYM